MLEIYNEQVRDLLTKENPKGGLQVSENHLANLNFIFFEGPYLLFLSNLFDEPNCRKIRIEL